MDKKMKWVLVATLLVIVSIGVVGCGKSDGFGVGGRVIITGGSQ